MDIFEATAKYESWLAGRLQLIPPDLELKHKRMAESAFPFLRATYYRWVQLLPESCPELSGAPAVLGVGDLHVENFGTWRDEKGRLIWGVNDFDEAFVIPYTYDLVRLATSALLAVDENALSINSGDACDAVLEGYSKQLKNGGEPFVLEDGHKLLTEASEKNIRDPERFWAKFTSLPTVGGPVPQQVLQYLDSSMPKPGMPFRVIHRQAGLGSLGRQRYTALVLDNGSMIAREAKALTVSASCWDATDPHGSEILYEKILQQAVRVPDPVLHMKSGWIIRRIAPDCARVELPDLPAKRDEYKLLSSMGAESANIHIKASSDAISKDLDKRGGKWLRKAAQAMAKATNKDWHTWKSK